MIKASELRPCNMASTISEEPEIIVIDGIDAVEETISGSGLLDVSVEDIEPIPLTEEWLKMLGFEGKDSDWWTNGVIELGYISQEEFYEAELTFPNMKWRRLELRYVHQLQNLYFALTGEELTIKEEVKA